MNLNEKIQDIILKANMRTDIDIVVTDEEMVIYYIGETDKCREYVYAEISDELKEIIKTDIRDIKFLENMDIVPLVKSENERYKYQAIYPMYKEEIFDKLIIFNSNIEFSESDKFIIKSMIYLIEKYMTE